MHNNTNNILKTIINQKYIDIANDKSVISVDKMKKNALKITDESQFYQKIKQKIANKQNAVIAEIKKQSPSQKFMHKNFEPLSIAKNYELAGATCLSIITDKKFFLGSDEYVQQISAITKLPILRKEFIIDSYQIYQAKVIGASAILLIATILNKSQIKNFVACAKDLGLDVLIEVHNQQELDSILNLEMPIIGINNRNLKNFTVSLNTTLELSKHIKNALIITESGIKTSYEVRLMNDHNIYGFLVGEAFMRQDNIIATYRNLFG